jgi:hypothetical protein
MEHEMNSRERVAGALERRKIDRIPLHLSCGGPNSALEALKAHYGAEDDDGLRDAMGIDIRRVSARYVGPDGKDPIGSDSGMDTVFGGTEYMACGFDGSGGIAGT